LSINRNGSSDEETEKQIKPQYSEDKMVNFGLEFC